MTWRDDALCRGEGHRWELPRRGLSHQRQRNARVVQAARHACSRCPVLEQCTDWVLGEYPDPCGAHVCAGMLPFERVHVRRQMMRSARRG